MTEAVRKSPGDEQDERAFGELAERAGRPRGAEALRAARQAQPGDRVLLEGVIESVRAPMEGRARRLRDGEG